MDEEVTEVFDCIRVTRRYLTRLAIPKVYQLKWLGKSPLLRYRKGKEED